MSVFCLKNISQENIINELKDIGFDSSYIEHVSCKYKYRNIKIFQLSLPQANILKQTALSVGADCAVHKDVLTAGVEKTDCILGGSYSQLKQIANKLLSQQFKMPILSEKLIDLLKMDEYNTDTKIVGILNLTKNSFSDGGKYFLYDDAIRHLHQLIEDGADIIDIGAESTKPYSEPVSAKEQTEKIEPLLKYIQRHSIDIPISIDTRSADVAKMSLDYGVSIINDVSGFDYDENMMKVVADGGVKIIIQHSSGVPETMQNNTCYKNLVDDIYKNLFEKIETAKNNGIKFENIIADVGIGFGKTREQNFELIKRICEFKSLGCPLMLGLSRKSLLNMPDSSNEEKDIYTLALNSLVIEKNIDFIRVHNVKLHKKLIEMMKVYQEV